jgi:F-type H+-transporting ATPase subunit gamma
MASIKDLKKRITSVKNTQQTTKAMKMVSAAKLRRAQEAIQNQRPYARRIGELIKLLSRLNQGQIDSPLVHREVADGTLKKALLVVVTSDRGLCGGFNTNVIKAAQKWVAANKASYQSIHLGFVGKRGYDFFKNKSFEKGPYFQEAGGKVTFDKAKQLASDLLARYTAGEYDEVKFVFNEFKNAVLQTVVVEGFLPLAQDDFGEGKDSEPSIEDESFDFIVKPSTPEVLESLLRRNFPIQSFRVLLESQASEHGARMSAMENATKNAGEMIRKLSIQHNKQRQAGITTQLLEIISGSESQKSSA